MKKVSLLLFASMLMLSVAFVSCSKDDDDEPKDSEFTYENVKYDLSHGVLMYEGTMDSSSHVFFLGLYSPGISIDTSSEDGGSGAGEIIYFELYSSSNTLDVGTYNSAGTSAPTTYDFGLFVININVDNGSFDNMGRIASGPIDIEKDGSTYIMSFDCLDPAGKPIIGYYEGPLEYVDVSEDLMKKNILLN